MRLVGEQRVRALLLGDEIEVEMSEMEVEMGMMVDRARGAPAQANEHAHTPLSSGRGGRLMMVERMERVLTPSPPFPLLLASRAARSERLSGVARPVMISCVSASSARRRGAKRRVRAARERVGCLAVLGVYQRTPNVAREARVRARSARIRAKREVNRTTAPAIPQGYLHSTRQPLFNKAASTQRGWAVPVGCAPLVF